MYFVEVIPNPRKIFHILRPEWLSPNSDVSVCGAINKHKVDPNILIATSPAAFNPSKPCKRCLGKVDDYFTGQELKPISDLIAQKIALDVYTLEV